MNIQYSSNSIPEILTDYLHKNSDWLRFRIRAVLVRANSGRWRLVSCTVEAILPDDIAPHPSLSRTYENAVLYEEWCESSQCLEFVQGLQQGRAQFGEIEIAHNSSSQWTTERLPVNSDYMARAGQAVGIRFGEQEPLPPGKALLAIVNPYYPDVDEAARDWMPYRVYHGGNDGRNNQIFFLLPEARAYIQTAEFSTEATLCVRVAGTQTESLSLIIKGAYWIDKRITHFEGALSASKAEFCIPSLADRLECWLIDNTGEVYDFRRDSRISGSGSSRSAFGSANRAKEQLVRDALQEGEGTYVEFKPFVDPAQPFNVHNQKTKLLEIIRTVVAFANTQGGRIFLGVDDDCSVTGIDQKLCEWVKGAVDEVSTNRYLGALKSKIKDLVVGEVGLHVWCVRIDGALVTVIDVPPAVAKPLTIQQDFYLYSRSGASNRRIAPQEWKTFLDHASYAIY